MKYRPEIDGLRAIAVLSVFLFHLGFKQFSGGFVGVDIFFVISGYLITSIIYKDLQNSSFTFAKFYERRIRRIIPALYFVLLACVLFTFKFFMINEMEKFGQGLLSSVLFYSNMLFWHQSGYFDIASEMKPLLHTWSLAIEEQFYIFFPALLILLYRKHRPRLVKILFVFFLCSLSLNIVGAERNWSSAFFFVSDRAWELLLGSLLVLAQLPKLKGKFVHEFLSALGLGMIAYGIFMLTEKSVFPGLNAAIPSLGTTLVLYSSEGMTTWCNKILGSKPFVFIGKISYSLYLWHWPAIVFAKYLVMKELRLENKLVILISVLILSGLSWKFIEQPFRNKNGKFKDTKKMVMSFAIVTLIMMIFGFVGGYLEEGFPERLQTKVKVYSKGSYDFNPDEDCMKSGLERIHNASPCLLGDKKNEKSSFMVWGDSHADAFMPAFQLMAHKNNTFGEDLSYSACAPLLGVIRAYEHRRDTCEQFNQEMISYIEKNKIENVVLVSRWTTNAVSFIGNKEKVKKNDVEAFSYGLNNTLKRLKDNHVNIWIVKKIPMAEYDIPSFLGRYEMFGKSTSQLQIDFKDYEKQSRLFNSVIDPLVSKYDIHIIDLSQILCSADTGKCIVEVDGKSLYRDNHHLSKYGAEHLSTVLQPLFDDIKKQPIKF